MLRIMKKLLGEKGKQLSFPIALMSLDAVFSIILYFILYLTVIHLLDGALTAQRIAVFTAVCLVSVIIRLVIYRNAYYLCFVRGAEMCGKMRLDLANHYRSLSLGYFNQNSSGYLLGTLTRDLSNFEAVITHTLPSIIKNGRNGRAGANRHILYKLEAGIGRMCCVDHCRAHPCMGKSSCRKVWSAKERAYR